MKFKNTDADTLYEIVSEEVFPFIKAMGDSDSTYYAHMEDVQFTIPTSALLAKVVDMLDDIPMEDRDTKGNLLFSHVRSRRLWLSSAEMDSCYTDCGM